MDQREALYEAYRTLREESLPYEEAGLRKHLRSEYAEFARKGREAQLYGVRVADMSKEDLHAAIGWMAEHADILAVMRKR